MDIQQIFENAKRDPALLAQLDLEELFQQSPSVNRLENTSLKEINTIIFQKIKEITQNEDEIAELCGKLAEYQYIDEIFEIQRGRYIRYIHLEKEEIKLGQGGVVVDIKFIDSGTHILCKSYNRFFQINVDKHLVFQKLSDDEQLYLMACDYLKR